MGIKDQKSEQYNLEIKSGQSKSWSWIQPFKEQSMRIVMEQQEIILRQSEMVRNISECLEVNMEEQTVWIYIDNQESYKQILVTQEKTEAHVSKLNEPQDQTHFNLSIQNLSLSLIGYDQPSIIRKEILYLHIKSPLFQFDNFGEHYLYNLSLKQIQIDENINLNTNDILLQITKQKDLDKHNKYHLQLSVDFIRQSHNFIQIKKFICLVQPTTVRITDQLVDYLIAFLKQFNTNSNINNKIYQTQSNLNSNKNQIPLQQKQFLIVNIEELVISHLFLTISFKSRKVNENIFLNALGLAVINVDETMIVLDGYKIRNKTQKLEQIIENILQWYKTNIIRLIFQIFGSIDILGNPWGLAKHIGMGIFDLIDKPIEGFTKGPIEGTLGIMEGGVSFLKNTTEGTCNSFEKSTRSIANMISVLSQDDEYQRLRQKLILQKAPFIWNGFYQGVQCFSLSVFFSISGIIQQPKKQINKFNSIFGIVPGLLKATSGLFVKPLTGAIDLFSKTTEGLKNSTTYFDDKPQSIKIRKNRVIYSKDQYLKDYNENDSKLIDFIFNLKNNKYQEYQLIDAINLKLEDSQDTPFQYQLAVFQQKIFMIHNQSQYIVIWKIKPQNIKSINSDNYEGIFIKPKEQKKNQNDYYKIYVTEFKLKEYISSLINNIVINQ